MSSSKRGRMCEEPEYGDEEMDGKVEG